MVKSLEVEFRRTPSAAAYMAGAFFPPASRRRAGPYPPLVLRWRGHRPEPRRLRELLALTGLPDGPFVPLLYPHVFGFRLHMALLTHPACPAPIWRVLQIRNHLVQRRPLRADEAMDLETRVAGQRILDKGAEVDLHTTVAGASGEAAWESLVTFYLRGRFGEPAAPAPLAAAPEVAGGATVARFRLPSRVGWRFGRFTGDYNGLHIFDGYARRLGFPRAFYHPAFVLGQCLARLPALDPGLPCRLDAWLKGPVFHGSEVALRSGGDRFALHAGDDPRPAIVGRLRALGMAEAAGAFSP